MIAAGERTEDVIVGGLRWQVQAEHRDRLFSPAGLRLDEWLRAGQAAVVKHGPHRTVYRVELPGLRFYLKHYRLNDTRAFLRELVRPAKARMEYERAWAVARSGVPTVEPLAVGEPAAPFPPGDSYLITRSLDGVHPLNTFLEMTFPALPAVRQPIVRQRLAAALARLVARLHAGGILHNDLHPGNLLVRLDDDERPLLYLIDLHAVRLHDGPLAWTTCRANLVMLNRWFLVRASRSDRLRFWWDYCHARALLQGARSQSERPTLRIERREQARDLERRTRASSLRFWSGRDRRCRATNRYYERLRTAAAAGYAVRDLDRPALLPLLADPDEPFRRPGVRLLKDSPSSTVAELDVPVGGVCRRVVYKRFRVTAWTDPWTALVRPTAAVRSWVYGQGLRERALPTPRPLAVFHRRCHGLPQEGYLLTEQVQDAIDLNRFVVGLADRRVLYCLIEAVARLVRALHGRQLSHRDLKATNLLVQSWSSGNAAGGLEFGDPSFGRLWLIDLVGVRRHRRLDWARKVKNLARLHVSFYQSPLLTRTDRLRFLRIYLQWGLFGRAGWKRWWREVERAARAKIERNCLSGRPIG